MNSTTATVPARRMKKDGRGVTAVFLRSPGGLIAVVILGTLFATALLAPSLLDEQASARDSMNASQGPSADHPLGTDALARDILARTLVATRLSLVMAVAATAIGSVIGVFVGAALALVRGRFRSIGARAIDGLLAFPSVLMGIFVAAILGAGSTAAVLGIGIALAPQFARITMNKALGLIAEDFVRVAEVMGVPRRLVIKRHLLPNVAESVGVVTLVTIGEATIAVSSLSFLGLGVVAPDYDWGQLLTEGIASFQLTPYAALAPAVMITLVGISTSLLGDTLARALNPIMAWRTAEQASSEAVATESAPPGRAGEQQQALDTNALISVRRLRVEVTTPAGAGAPVRDVSFDLARGEMLGVVGESGSGKTMTALALAGLQGPMARVRIDALAFDSVEADGPTDTRLRERQRSGTAVVFQDPMSSFNPLLRVGTQIGEGAPKDLSRKDRADLLEKCFADVHISAPKHRIRQFPHELSGGMRQRAMVAGALLRRPQLIVADEPTTSLDVSTQAQIMTLIRRINREHSTAVLLISHDIALVSQNCTRILVMYAGRVVEELPSDRVREASHPYTQVLIAATPTMSEEQQQSTHRTGTAPPITAPDQGCAFAPRCTLATEICRTEVPVLVPNDKRGRVACWHPVGDEVTP